METRNTVIREISDDVYKDSVAIICRAFATVAEELGLTKENCPSHPSFITIDKLDELKTKGVKFFGLFLGGEQVGFVALENAGDAVFYMEKLAILPDYRHKGYGGELVRFAIDYVRDCRGKKISIGIIDKQTVLKDWYADMGFRETEIKEFDFLPFTVCLMELDIS